MKDKQKEESVFKPLGEAIGIMAIGLLFVIGMSYALCWVENITPSEDYCYYLEAVNYPSSEHIVFKKTYADCPAQ